MEDYKPNSHKSREEQKALPSERKKVEKVVKGNVKRKKNNVRKITDTFVSEDMENVKSYVLFDVLVPAVKKAIADIVSNGIEMLLYGTTNGSKRNNSSTYVSYNKYSSDRRDDRYSNGTRRGIYSFDDIVFSSRGEAEDVRERMDELIDMYGNVSVADMCDLAGVSCNYTDNKYGWTNIRNAEIVRVRDGYIIKMPKALPL